ncbi:hypothetical protein Tco_1405623 [Tanacetum coccineum]
MMCTPRKMMRVPFTLPPCIKEAIAEYTSKSSCKRCRSISPPTPPPPPSSSIATPSSLPPSPSSISPSPPPDMLPPHKRDEESSPNVFEFGESSTAAHVLPVTGELIHHTIPLLVARMVRHERQIHEMEDHMEELPLERFEAMKQDIKGLRDDMASL